ncbi:hypothetical protein EV368DRAFT_84114 [Lentinula lateritia]|uniref:Uncharacterized protein n=1 Tax=Lentinula aff. lateritia TaxID=2804960 RepID=A0ACC1U7D0_9AGAR|nr:hypothetical protein F5876DRAFT_74697 [Lentinula aff. lateritia]KAJ3850865.1 hypothetical protein EV368DRAFT_84114 [Lentinula lateritia]
MSDLDVPSACRISDSDISGIGVRSSFYLQSFLLVILVDRSTDASTSLWTFTAASFGLTIAAVMQYAKQQLSLLEALQVSNLVWQVLHRLANLGIFVALASYSRHKRNTRRKRGRKKPRRANSRSRRPERGHEWDYGVKTASMVQTILSMALTLYMWAAPENFAPSQCLDSLTYVLFVWRIPVRHSGRIVGLTFSSILTCVYIAITLHEYWISYRKRKLKSKKKDSLSPPPVLGRTIPLPLALLSIQSSDYKSSPQTSSRSSLPPSQAISQIPTPTKPNRPNRKLWSNIDPMFIGILIFETIVFLYLIVSNEILLRDNHADTGEFGFGQVCIDASLLIIVWKTDQ